MTEHTAELLHAIRNDDFDQVVVRMDDWLNTAAGFGGVRDKASALTFIRRCRLQTHVLEALYEQQPYCARVVDKIVDDSLSCGFQLTNTDAPKGYDLSRLSELYDEINLLPAIRQTDSWSRLYGGAAMLLPISDGRDTSEPLDLAAAQDIYALTPFAAPYAIPFETDMGIGSSTYGKTLSYDLINMVDPGMLRAHASRVVSFEPCPMPLQSTSGRAQPWGPSVLERIFDDLGRDGASAAHAISMMYIASVMWIGIKGWSAQYQKQGGPAQLKKMLADFRQALDSKGVLGMDAEDKVGNMSLAIPGAHELIGIMRDRLAAAGDMPREIAFNESPTGLRGGELSGAQALWNKQCQQHRTHVLQPRLVRILKLLFAIRKVPITRFEIEWPPLWEPDTVERADAAGKYAQADAVYIDKGVVTADQVFEHRIVNGKQTPLEVPEDEGGAPDLLSAVAAQTAAEAQPVESSGAPAVQDQALNGAQSASLTATIEKYNMRAISYNQALGILTLSFPGRNVVGVLGTPPLDRDAVMGAPAAPLAPGADAPAAEVMPAAEDPHAPPPDPATPREAAAAWGLKTVRITRWIKSGDLPYWGHGSAMIVSKSAVGRLMKAHEGEPEPEGDDA